MRENIKILIYIGLAFLISFGVLGSFLILHHNGYLIEANVQEIKIGVKNKIFLLGTSFVGNINATHVQKILNEHGLGVVVLNNHNTDISNTLQNIDDLVSHNPKLIVYGVGFSDLGLWSNECSSELSLYEIPDKFTEQNMSSTQKLIVPNTFDFEYNPKLTTISVLKHVLVGPEIKYVFEENNKKSKIDFPEFLDDEITPIVDLEKTNLPTLCFNSEIKDTRLNYLDKIFMKFNDANIDVVVFIPPFTEVYLESIPDKMKFNVSNSIELISKKYNYDFYDLSTKFKNSDIFHDFTHVAQNPNSLVYSESISSMIQTKFSKSFPTHNIINEEFFEHDLSGMDLSDSNLFGVNLEGRNLENTLFINSILINSNLSESSLLRSILSGTILTGADLSGAILVGADLSGADLVGANLSYATLTNTILKDTYLTFTTFTDVILTGADLTKTNLANVDLTESISSNIIFSNADLSGANLGGADLTGANLTGSTLTNTILKDTHLTFTTFTGVILTDVDLSGKSLKGIKFINSKLIHVKFNGSILDSSDFSLSSLIDSEMNHSTFINSNFSYAKFFNSNLQGSNFSNSNFTHTYFNNSNLSESNFINANMSFTLFENSDITNSNFESVILEDHTFLDIDMNCINHAICK